MMTKGGNNSLVRIAKVAHHGRDTQWMYPDTEHLGDMKISLKIQTIRRLKYVQESPWHREVFKDENFNNPRTPQSECRFCEFRQIQAPFVIP